MKKHRFLSRILNKVLVLRLNLLTTSLNTRYMIYYNALDVGLTVKLGA